MIKEIAIKIGKFTFDAFTTGKVEHKLIIFLHGFPETSFMWRKLMLKLSEQGYFCVAPNMRGYSTGARPKGIKHYAMKNLSDDILSIADSFGKTKFHLVGHDWGAAIGWNIVFNNYERILSWSALSVPHNRAFTKAIKLDKDQKRRSSYIMWFLLPWIPEFIIRRNNFQKLRTLWRNSDEEEVQNYLSVFKSSYALTAALNYYRANIGRGKNTKIGDIHAPTLFIWGNKDVAIGPVAAQNNHAYMKGMYTFLEVNGGHWLMQSNYAEIEQAVVSHINSL